VNAIACQFLSRFARRQVHTLLRRQCFVDRLGRNFREMKKLIRFEIIGGTMIA
jgi:hypothetical protein